MASLRHSPLFAPSWRTIVCITAVTVQTVCGYCCVLMKCTGIWFAIRRVAGKRFGGIDGRPLQVFPQKASARFVRLQLNETQYLHLDEIEIY